MPSFPLEQYRAEKQHTQRTVIADDAALGSW